MTKWTTLINQPNRFKLSCGNDNCSLSICNLINGKIHITTIHDNKRHSLTFSSSDMVFVISQFISCLPEEDKIKLLDFYQNNLIKHS